MNLARSTSLTWPVRCHVDLLLEWMRRTRFCDGIECPRCRSRHVHRWGSFSGRQRYRCARGCGRTFSDLTGTPAAYIKKLDRWPAFGEGMELAESLRAAARRLGVHVSTAFRWRHRLLAGLVEGDRDVLGGWVELNLSNGYVESKKGERKPLGREARTHGIRYPRHRAPESFMGVLVACDRRDRVVTGVVEGLVPSAADLSAVLDGRIRWCEDDRRVVVMAQRPKRGPIGRFTVRRGGRFIDVRSARRRSGLVGVERAKAYDQRLRRWMIRFRGVATRYLARYLTWHRLLDRGRPDRTLAAILGWPHGRSLDRGAMPGAESPM